jgi:hypothetical protein
MDDIFPISIGRGPERSEVKILSLSGWRKTSRDFHSNRRFSVRSHNATGKEALLSGRKFDRLIERRIIVPPLGIAEPAAGCNQG